MLKLVRAQARRLLNATIIAFLAVLLALFAFITGFYAADAFSQRPGKVWTI